MHSLDFDFLATYPTFTVNVKNYLFKNEKQLRLRITVLQYSFHNVNMLPRKSRIR